VDINLPNIKKIKSSMSSISVQQTFQETDSICGPAVIQMLLNFYNIKITQKEAVEAAGISEVVERDGTRLDQMSLVVKNLAPGYAFWYKEDATIQDISALIDTYHVPVGINWQGYFWDSLLEEARFGAPLSNGHYSIVTNIQREKNQLAIVDPDYKRSAKELAFPIGWFKTRWWDTAQGVDDRTGKEITYYTSRLLFIVVPEKETFPQLLDLHAVPEQYFQSKIEEARHSHSVHPAFEPSKRKTQVLEFSTSVIRNATSKFR